MYFLLNYMMWYFNHILKDFEILYSHYSNILLFYISFTNISHLQNEVLKSVLRLTNPK